MTSYRIKWKQSALKELKRTPKEIISRVIKSVELLATDPYPVGVKKLVGAEQTYRIRVGDYRVIYTIMEDLLLIEIVRVGHRKDVYR